MSDKYTKENRIAVALSVRGLKQVDLVEKTGLNKTSINGWVKQRWQPKQRALMLMAKALDVSEMWLAGYDVPMERPAAQKNIDELATLINIIRKNDKLKSVCISLSTLDDKQLDTISVMIQGIKSLSAGD